MIVPVTKVIQSLLQAHSGQYVTGNYSVSMYRLFVSHNCWGGWLPQPHHIVPRLEGFSSCPVGCTQVKDRSSDAKRN